MIRQALASLSTATKMLLMMTAALLPLGILALLVSIDSVRTNAVVRQGEAHAMTAAGANGLSATLGRLGYDLRAAAGRLPELDNADECAATLRSIAALDNVRAEFAIYDLGRREICRTPGFSGHPAALPQAPFVTEVGLLPDRRLLRFEARSGAGRFFGVGEIGADTLAALATQPGLDRGAAIMLRQGEVTLPLTPGSGRPARRVSASAPVAGGQLDLIASLPPAGITGVELLMASLPLLMWAAAAITSWVMVNWLLIKPLKRIERAIAGYRPGQAELEMPGFRTPAYELRMFLHSFQDVARRLADHERELEEGLQRQTKLTREVHHRVKNNLQVVSSLINLHARGVADKDVVAAYGSIQRRVDALAVVHRNHYAELEENRGVGLRSLLGELAANLRATAPPEAAGLVITLDVVPCFAHQDVAVPVAFLVTEIVEMAMQCDARGTVAVVVTETDTPGRARLSITAAGLASEACRRMPTQERFGRVIEGLSRQLRTKLQRDEARGAFSIEISVAC